MDQHPIETVWDALFILRENCIPESDPTYDACWADICLAMARITEDLGLEYNREGDLIPVDKL